MTPPSAWNLVSEALHADCRVFKVFRRKYRHPRDEREGVFFTLHAGDWVMVLAVTTDGRLVFTRQYRFGSLALSWEPPGGVMEAGEDVVEAGLRELREETGFVAGSARCIGKCSPNPALTDNTIHFVLAENCETTGRTDFDPLEEIETRVFTIREVDDLVARDGLSHALALAALYRLKLARPDLWA